MKHRKHFESFTMLLITFFVYRMSGYTGVHCEEDIDECISQNISCGDKGTCINTNGSYM